MTSLCVCCCSPAEVHDHWETEPCGSSRIRKGEEDRLVYVYKDSIVYVYELMKVACT